MRRFTNNPSWRAQYVNVKIKSSRSSYFAKETNTHVFLMASLWLLEAISLRNSLSKSFQLFLPDIFIPPCDCKCFKREMYLRKGNSQGQKIHWEKIYVGKKGESKRCATLESIPVIRFYWSVCYCNWWSHYIWWMEHIADEANFFESIFSTAAWGFVYCGLWESYVDLIYGPFSLKDHIFIIDQNSTAHGTARPFVTIL